MTKVEKKPKAKKAIKHKAKAAPLTLPHPLDAEGIYDQIVKSLPIAERFKLAQLILTDISPRAVVDYSEEWTEEDMREFSEWSWRYILERVEREEREGGRIDVPSWRCCAGGIRRCRRDESASPYGHIHATLPSTPS